MSELKYFRTNERVKVFVQDRQQWVMGLVEGSGRNWVYVRCDHDERLKPYPIADVEALDSHRPEVPR